MISRCFRRAFASRSGWHPPARRSPGLQQAPKHQRSLDEPLRSHSAAPEPGWEQSRRSTSRPTYPPVKLILYGIAWVLGTGVFFVYRDWLGENGYLPEWLKSPHLRDQAGFEPHLLSRKQPVSTSMTILHFHPGSNESSLKSFAEAWKKGVWNITFKQPQIQIVRAYTPLPPLPGGGPGQDLRFLIRHDNRGEVSSWLNRLPPGSKIEMRGPNLELAVPPWTQHITFLAGGTGIAPALQAANALLSGSAAPSGGASPSPTIHILWASRQREDCRGGISDHSSSPPKTTAPSGWNWVQRASNEETSVPAPEKGLIVGELDALKARFPGQVIVDYFVDEEGTWITDEHVANSIMANGRSSQGNGTATHQLIISGPEGFIDYLAGPKMWRDGRQQQGPVGGIVAQALKTTKNPYQVWKV